MNPTRDEVLDNMNLEGLQDNRFKLVNADEAREVSANRHSDRDLLDAHLATEIAHIPFPEESGVPEGFECVPMPIVEDAAEHPLFKGRAVLVKHLLSNMECGLVCEAASAHGLSELLLCGGTKRRCERVPFKSPQLNDMLYSRVAPLLSDIHITPTNRDMFLNKGMEGVWRPVGLSDVFRVVRYHASGHIAPHYDGEWVQDEETRSIKTILIYLNEDYTGGLTRLLDHRDDDVGTRFEETAKGATTGCASDVVGVVPAETGIAIMFDAKMLHEGTELLSGTKWLLRADVVYHRVERMFAEDSNRSKAVELLNEAEYFEESGRADLAVRNYRAAYKLCPELEFEG